MIHPRWSSFPPGLPFEDFRRSGSTHSSRPTNPLACDNGSSPNYWIYCLWQQDNALIGTRAITNPREQKSVTTGIPTHLRSVSIWQAGFLSWPSSSGIQSKPPDDLPHRHTFTRMAPSPLRRVTLLVAAPRVPSARKGRYKPSSRWVVAVTVPNDPGCPWK